jgi:hypothetical protein
MNCPVCGAAMAWDEGRCRCPAEEAEVLPGQGGKVYPRRREGARHGKVMRWTTQDEKRFPHHDSTPVAPEIPGIGWALVARDYGEFVWEAVLFVRGWPRTKACGGHAAAAAMRAWSLYRAVFEEETATETFTTL